MGLTYGQVRLRLRLTVSLRVKVRVKLSIRVTFRVGLGLGLGLGLDILGRHLKERYRDTRLPIYINHSAQKINQHARKICFLLPPSQDHSLIFELIQIYIILKQC